MKKKKLLITSDTFPPRVDGVSVFLRDIIPSLAKKFDITVLAPKYKGRLPDLPCKIIRIPLGHINFGDYKPAQFRIGLVNRLVKEADLVYNQNFGPIGISAMHAASRLKKPLVAYIFSIQWELFSHSIGKGKAFIKAATKKAAKYFYNKVDLLIVPAKSVKKAFTDIGVKSKKTIIPLRIYLNNFPLPSSKKRAKKKLGLEKNFVFGYVGRFAREKDLPTLCTAFKKIAKRYPEAVLLMVGGGLKIPQSNHPQIIKVGEQTDVVQFLHAMDVFVLPSLTETCSLATEEAMACGLPIITTKVGWVEEYVSPKKNGLFFNKGDSTDLAYKMELLLVDETLRLTMGKQARKTALKLFDIKKSIKEITKALTSLC